MTLILGLLTDQYVTLVSDRRVTWMSPTGRITKQEDTDTQTFVICGHFLMGFTGYARFQDLPMEKWLSQVLKDVEPDPDAISNRTFDAIRDAATTEFGRLPYDARQEHHTFVVVGYANDADSGGGLVPTRLLISNSLNEQNQLVSRATGSTFRIAQEWLRNRRHLLTRVGYPPPASAMHQADTALRRVVNELPDDPLPAVDILVQCLRAGAESSNGTVGKNGMFATLPRRVVPASSFVVPLGGGLLTVDSRSEMLAGYIRSEAKTAREAEVYAPAIFCPRMNLGTAEMDPERLPPRQQNGQ